MSDYDYDLFVIGAGSGGVRSSRMASQLGAKVAICEDLFLGGTCVNVGCVPKKLFVYGSHCHEDFEISKGYGWNVPSPTFDWPTLRDNKTQEIERLNGVYRTILSNAGVELIEGRGRIMGPHSVQVGEHTYTAERIIIAVGGWPYVPEFPGNEHVISSNDAFYLETFPSSVLVVGGGYIAVEFTGIFNGLGAKTELSYRGPLFLRGFDDDVREFLAEQMSAKGIHLNFNSQIASIEKLDNEASEKLLVTFADGSQKRFDCVMYATGRKPKTADLGLEQTQVQCASSGAILVNDEFQTHEPSIYAIGDVIDRVALTPVALAEGMALAHRLYGNQEKPVSYDNIPTAVFSQPSIGTVGLSEAQAVEKYGEVKVFVSTFKPMKLTMTEQTERTLMKLLVDAQSDKVIGCHMVGPEAGEIMQGIGIAMKAGATKADFDSTIGIHPTAAEEFVTMREVSRVVRRDVK
ncbi:glutathione-disulfide reductase [Marinibactrum halimedae]|uniref:Glutathione-disulfide reductase n=1 Tax=Marinibactrum halimedae TaxID=1444977 RepID=A0AA37T9E4_9GAMM|nr:glutathione-disulfide reductase [Marinibactrum halimedae]MCD9460961.1 glutathione-disulfide reductase [Marinibactrum halimedae]GLS28096.1 glutathione-disulfide reductase [Marinibactrum halimedae]